MVKLTLSDIEAEFDSLKLLSPIKETRKRRAQSKHKQVHVSSQSRDKPATCDTQSRDKPAASDAQPRDKPTTCDTQSASNGLAANIDDARSPDKQPAANSQSPPVLTRQQAIASPHSSDPRSPPSLLLQETTFTSTGVAAAAAAAQSGSSDAGSVKSSDVTRPAKVCSRFVIAGTYVVAMCVCVYF